MPVFVQYDEDGRVAAVVSGTRPPLHHPRQVGFLDPPPLPPVPDPTHYTGLQAPDDLHGHRVHHDDAGKPFLKKCPKIARQRERHAVLHKMHELDARRPRAITRFLLNGEKKALEDIEAEAEALDAQLALLPEISDEK